MKTKLQHYLLCFCGLLLLSKNSQAQYHPETFVSDINLTGPVNGNTQFNIFYVPGILTSPGMNGLPVNISNKAFVEYSAVNEIRLTDGFRAGPFDKMPFAGNYPVGEFRTKLDNSIDVLVVDPASPVYSDGLLEVKKWEKFELAFKLPPEYETAISSFFSHYYTNPPVIPATDLNPYSSDSLVITFDFIDPNGITNGTTYTKFGFFMREADWGLPVPTVVGSELPIEVTTGPLADHHIHVRFAPNLESNSSSGLNWKVVMHIQAPFHSQLPAYNYPPFEFKCTSNDPDNRGYLKVNQTTKRTLQFDNPPNYDAFFGIGENFDGERHPGWYDDKNILHAIEDSNQGWWATFYKLEYDHILQSLNELAGAGGNYIRLFATYALIEQENLGVYDQYTTTDAGTCSCCGTPNGNRQSWLRMMDHIFERCHDNKIYMQYCFGDYPPQIAPENSTYGHNVLFQKYVLANAVPNTPLPVDKYFFSDSNHANSESFYYWKRKYKYFMSRYGYSVNLAVVEPFNEIDYILGYDSIDLSGTHIAANGITVPDFPDICPDHRLNYPQNLPLRNSISDWYTKIIDYVRAPAPAGVGEPNKLFAASFASSANLWELNLHQGYFNLWNLPQIDIVDVHLYSFLDDKEYSNRLAYTSKDLIRPILSAVLDKPVIFGECGNFGTIPNPDPALGAVNTNDKYNNYDISLHNEIWSSAFSGNMSTGLSWFYHIIHRWSMANSEPPPFLLSEANELGDPFTLSDIGGQPLATGTIATSYHNYRPLRDYIDNSGINFNENFEPENIYDEPNGLECYYLRNIDQNSAYGWIHNLNFYWANQYFYWTDPAGPTGYYNWSSCGTPTISSGINIDLLLPSTDYDINFYFTRMAIPPIDFPTGPFTLTTDATGHLAIGASVLGNYLGCDTMHADLAFSLNKVGTQRGTNAQNTTTRTKNNKLAIEFNTNLNAEKNKTHEGKEKKEDQFDFTTFPNPSSGIFSIQLKTFKDTKNNSYNLKIYDLTGRLLISQYNISTSSKQMDISAFAKGCYIISLTKNNNTNFSKIIIQ